jgi:LPXTG-motif cell wall-anchored protein
MGSGRARRAARMLAATGAAAALLGAAPGTAQAATEYDGDATALRIEGLQLELLPGATEATPEQLQPLVKVLKEIQSQAPEQLQRDQLTLAMPDQTIGYAEFPGTDTQGAIPENPLFTADFLEAKSVKTDDGGMISEASVLGLSLGGGVLSADVIKTSCVGNGDTITLDVSQLDLSSSEDIVDSRISLKSGTAMPIPGLATITFNQSDTDGSTYGEATNVVIDVNSDLSMRSLNRIFSEAAPAFENVMQEVLTDLSNTRVGPDGNQPFKEFGKHAEDLSGEQLYAELDEVVEQITAPTSEAPEELQNALNNLAHLDGTITVANAACSQAPVTEAAPQPQEPQQAVPAEPVSDTSEPPLADTGSPAGMVGMGLAGFAALAGGGYVLMRLRRRQA